MTNELAGIVRSQARAPAAVPTSRHRSFAAVLTFAFVTYLGALQLFAKVTPPSSYTLITWKWDYSLGFIKRGLVGWIAHAWANNVTPTFVFQVSIILYLACLLSYALFASIVSYRRPFAGTLVAASLMVILAPALPSFASTLGRLDQFNFPVLVACVLALVLGNGVLIRLSVALLCCIAILVHEGFAIVGMPLLCSLVLAKDISGAKRFPARDLALVGGLPLLTLLVVIAVTPPPISFSSFASYWMARGPFVPPSLPEHGWVNAIQYAGIAGNVRNTLRFANAHKFSFVYGALVAASLIPAAIALMHASTAGGRVHRVWWVVLVSCFSPLAMFLLGIDFIRWSSYVVINCVLLVLALAALEDLVPFGYWTALRARGLYIAAGFVAAFLCFPMTTGEQWPGFSRFDRCLYAAVLKPSLIEAECNDPVLNRSGFQ